MGYCDARESKRPWWTATVPQTHVLENEFLVYQVPAPGCTNWHQVPPYLFLPVVVSLLLHLVCTQEIHFIDSCISVGCSISGGNHWRGNWSGGLGRRRDFGPSSRTRRGMCGVLEMWWWLHRGGRMALICCFCNLSAWTSPCCKDRADSCFPRQCPLQIFLQSTWTN